MNERDEDEAPDRRAPGPDPAEPVEDEGPGPDPAGSLEGAAADPIEDEAIDLVAAARAAAAADGEAPDVTLGGYMAEHDRPAAFEGADGQPYTVDLDAEETGDPARPYAAFLVFVRWAETGAAIMDHVESGDVAFGPTAEDAKRAALDLSLYEVRAELDAAIARRRESMET